MLEVQRYDKLNIDESELDTKYGVGGWKIVWVLPNITPINKLAPLLGFNGKIRHIDPMWEIANLGKSQPSLNITLDFYQACEQIIEQSYSLYLSLQEDTEVSTSDDEKLPLRAAIERYHSVVWSKRIDLEDGLNYGKRKHRINEVFDIAVRRALNSLGWEPNRKWLNANGYKAYPEKLDQYRVLVIQNPRSLGYQLRPSVVPFKMSKLIMRYPDHFKLEELISCSECNGFKDSHSLNDHNFVEGGPNICGKCRRPSWAHHKFVPKVITKLVVKGEYGPEIFIGGGYQYSIYQAWVANRCVQFNYDVWM